jgi:hypothetical protein
MAVNAEYLFGSGTSSVDIYSFSIASDGALKQAAATNAQQHNSSGCGGLGPPLLDHTGVSLYAGVSVGGSGPGFDCAESSFQSYGVQKSTGELKYLGSNGDLFEFFGQLSFSGDNHYAYGAYCGFVEGQYVGGIDGFERHSNGLLTFAIDGPTPNPESAGDFYCPEASTTDPSNHLGVALQAVSLERTTSTVRHNLQRIRLTRTAI